MHTKTAERIIRGELSDKTLYNKLAKVASNDVATMLRKLEQVEDGHVRFWANHFDLPIPMLGASVKLKHGLLVLFARLFGDTGIHLVLEATESVGIRGYLKLWDQVDDPKLRKALRTILEDEFGHEDDILMSTATKRLNPDRIRDIFLGFNDGSVEILGAVAGFAATFSNTSSIFIAGFTVAIAGCLSMSAGAYAAVDSEKEASDLERRKEEFMNNEPLEEGHESPFASAVTVGVAYFIGAAVPILPYALGAEVLWYSVVASGALILLVSAFVAMISGISIKKRILLNVAIITVTVGITYGIGTVVQQLFDVSV
jgi:predicted membrane protein (TIGR00267 family)